MHFKKRSPSVDGSLPVCPDLSGSLCCLTFSKKMMERAPLGRVEGWQGRLPLSRCLEIRGTAVSSESLGRKQRPQAQEKGRVLAGDRTAPPGSVGPGGGRGGRVWGGSARLREGQQRRESGRCSPAGAHTWVWGPASLPLQGRGLALLTAASSSPLGEAAELGARHGSMTAQDRRQDPGERSPGLWE